MSPHVKIQWIGIRKDSGRGSVWGWFTETGKKEFPNRNSSYSHIPEDPVFCHVFWGSIGKKMHIEQRELTYEFLSEVKTRTKNFKEQAAEKTTSRWGKVFEEEFSMYLLLLKMKG